MKIKIFIVVSILLLGFIDSIKDANQFHKTVGKSSFWGGETWKNKYTLDENGNFKPYLSKWYYFSLHKPTYKEKFPYSSTFLVSLTDGFHLMKLFYTTLIAILISFLYTLSIEHKDPPKNIFLSSIFFIILVKILMMVGFYIGYDIIFT